MEEIENIEKFECKKLPEENDTFAPCGPQIRLLTKTTRGNMVHCRLGAGLKTKAVTHKTIDELWYFTTGEGKVWRFNPDSGYDEIKKVECGVSLSIPQGTHFQIRNTGEADLDFIIVNIPPWPGDEESLEVKGGL